MVFNQNSGRAASFKSAYGPKYHYEPNLNGLNKTTLFRLGLRTASFGGAAAIAAIFYTSGIPRIQRDILQPIPFFGKFFIKEEVPASDNPF
ncbi:hypothetical protein DCS_00272 [Drechmeria coniospora]|uniref:Uncharacterized protein n=1 Tax=Drechmeria coniospora TaxID=98403 RepID=A0A151GQ73_DRECN|nr:hypothetical protein DCS_00272 [Drechmeria coniospora]KYK59142.1 hypothetical protein DCS_00272 [Drechmeria coniospora]